MLPPGPWYPALWQTYRFVTDPFGYSRDVIARYGNTMRTRALNAKGVAVSSPDMVKLVFAADPDTYETVPVLAELFGPAAVIATAGPKHKKQRKLLNPRFQGSQMRAFLAAMQRVTDANLASFASAQASGEPIAMIDVAQDITLDVILETVFGDTPDLDREGARRILKELVRALSPALMGAPFLRASWFPAWRRFTAARAAFDAMVDARVAERRAAAAPGTDLLGALVAARYEDGAEMDGAEIRDQLYTILLAGHETTAVTLSWAVYFLLREPAVLDKLRAELATVDPSDLQATLKLPYLEAVCNEALRIEPAVTDVARVCKKPLALGPYTVPAGEVVFVNVTFMLRDPSLYPEPHAFRPERFLERSYGPAEFVPFGGGQRRCLGAAFAQAELAIVLATLARDFRLELADDEPERAVRRNITMGPKNGVRVRVVRGPS
jgi:cytochrome P450